MSSRRNLLIVISGVVLFAGILLFAVAHLAEPMHKDNPDIGQTQPLYAASFPDLQGQPQAMQQWQGHVLVVNFWASWCPPCRDEMPELSALAQQYARRGVAVVGISTDDVAIMQQFARDAPVSYPLLAGGDAGMELSVALGNAQRSLPYTLVLRRDGSVAASHVGRLDVQALESTLAPLL